MRFTGSNGSSIRSSRTTGGCWTADEAGRWLDEILGAIEREPDDRIHAGYPRDVELHSSRDVYLFEVLNVVRAPQSTARSRRSSTVTPMSRWLRQRSRGASKAC